MRIRSYPSRAVIYINGERQGTAPLLLDLPEGNYTIRGEKSGYYPDSVSISFSEGEYREIALDLEEITGSLLVETFPVPAEIRTGWKSITPGVETELRIGRYVVVIEAFGYETLRKEVLIEENRTSAFSVELEKAPFRIEWFRPDRERFDPDDPGIYGSTRISVSVSAPGEAIFSIYHSSGGKIGASRTISFDKRWSHITWDGKEAQESGKRKSLQAGRYTVELMVPNSEIVVTEEVIIDPSIDLRVRTVYTGAAGTLLCPLPSALPKGVFQAGLHGYAHGKGSSYLIPTSLSLRFSPRDREEIAISGGLILNSDEDVNPYGSLSWNIPLSSSFRAGSSRAASSGGESDGPRAAGAAALLLKGSFFNSSEIDILEGSSGISAALPLVLTLGPLSAAISPEIYAGPDPQSGSAITSWIYGKGALILDIASVSVALSSSVRSEPFSEAVSIRWPMASALEFIWLLPDKPFSISAGALLEWSPDTGWYLSTGGGIWFLP